VIFLRFKLGAGLERYLRSAAIVICVMTMASCASYGNHASNMRDGLLKGQPEKSLLIAEGKDKKEVEVISSLDKGMLRRINQKYSASNQIFEVAKQEIEKLYGISITENLAAITVNETLRGYEGDPYEQLLLHAYMAMNYLDLGDGDAARVEMAQVDVKMQEWHEDPQEDAFVRYFAGMIYEYLNEPDEALISYRKAYLVYKEKGGAEYPVTPLNLKKDLLRLTKFLGLDDEHELYKKEFSLETYHYKKADKNTGELIVILNHGLAPIRGETAIPIFSSEVEKNLRVAFPVYKTPKKRLRAVRVTVSPEITAGSQDKKQDEKQLGLESIEDIDALARKALADAMPGIMARATARAVIKYNTQHNAQEKDSLAGFIMTVANLVTERADTRSWSTLPEEIQLQRISLPVGTHKVSIEIMSQAGFPVDRIEQDVEIKPAQISFIIKHWIAPVVRTKQVNTASDKTIVAN